jgi:outer membrane biosynthesis protein TonB
MDRWFNKLLFILIFSQISSACSIDMIVGAEDDPYIDKEATLRILPAFRSHLSADEDPRVSEQFATKNQIALRDLDAKIRQLNRLHPSIRHTLVTENNDANFDYSDYIKTWKITLEEYGNSKYPKGLVYQTPNGNALVDVAITKSGKLYSYNIVLSSGSPKLNSAVKFILDHNRLFAPLSLNIQKNTDVLHIAQMWQFRHYKQPTKGY